MNVRIEIDEEELKQLVYAYIARKLGDVEFERQDVQIEVKSTQNWKSEWESAAFRAVVEVA